MKQMLSARSGDEFSARISPRAQPPGVYSPVWNKEGSQRLHLCPPVRSNFHHSAEMKGDCIAYLMTTMLASLQRRSRANRRMCRFQSDKAETKVRHNVFGMRNSLYCLLIITWRGVLRKEKKSDKPFDVQIRGGDDRVGIRTHRHYDIRVSISRREIRFNGAEVCSLRVILE